LITNRFFVFGKEKEFSSSFSSFCSGTAGSGSGALYSIACYT
jgi:hypothetical protein